MRSILKLARPLGRGSCVAILIATLAACDDSGPSFDDHTVPRLATAATFAAMAEQGPSVESVKLVITDFSTASKRRSAYLDSAFFKLHDEWYWYRLMNGQAVAGDGVAPVSGHEFATVAEVGAWAKQELAAGRKLPLDLVFVEGTRLYSPRFYELGLMRTPRSYGITSIVHAPARGPRPEIWAFELEYTDFIDAATLAVFFQEIARTTPPEIGGRVKWLVRSPYQEALARQMEAQHLPYYDRILRYKELVVPGTAEVYSPGLTAGRLRVIRAGEPIDHPRASDILVFEQVPDFLPPCAGLVTAFPQTPLAHVNVLARNRGIPNVHLAGVLDDPNLDQYARVQAPVILRAEAPDRVDLVGITESEYAVWVSITGKEVTSVPPIDLTGVANSYDLASFALPDLDRVRPIIGGKNSGYLAILTEPGLEHPDRPLAISIKPFIEHTAQLRPRIEAMLMAREFQDWETVRFLLLEGPSDFVVRFPSDSALVDSYRARPAGDVLGDLVRAGGLKQVIRDQPMNPATLADITASLRQHFGDFATSQGLRFRSSSNLEDLEGFNGAGLYDSNTGFLDAAAQPDPKDQQDTIEAAIKKTWSSFWAFEAFEERRLQLVDHLSGAMGVLAHARFDDDKELHNGVITYTVMPPEAPVEGVLELNAQQGFISVTNPPPGLNTLPEIDRVILDRGAAMPRIERAQGSNQAPPGTILVDDPRLIELFARARSMTERWLANANATRPPAQRSRTFTLDFEFRDMAAGWPALASGVVTPGRFVVKQARPLEPATRGDKVLGMYAVPRDVLVRTRRAERRICQGESFTLSLLETYTDPLLTPDLGYGVAPFSAEAKLEVSAAIPELGLAAGATLSLTHLDYAFSHPGMAAGGVWNVTLGLTADAAAANGLDAIVIAADGTWHLRHGAAEIAGTIAGGCTTQALFASPRDYLLGLLEKHGKK